MNWGGYVMSELTQDELFPRIPFPVCFQLEVATGDVFVQDLESRSKEAGYLYLYLRS